VLNVKSRKQKVKISFVYLPEMGGVRKIDSETGSEDSDSGSPPNFDSDPVPFPSLP